MKKIIGFLTLLILVSCNGSGLNNRNEPKEKGAYSVDKTDIRRVVSEYLSDNSSQRSVLPVNPILSIDSIVSVKHGIRNAPDLYIPTTPLYFVRLQDGSTIVVAGDKRAEPIRAHLRKISFSFSDGRLNNQNDIPDPIKFILGVCSASLVDEVNSQQTTNPHWNGINVRASHSTDYVQPSKCLVSWGQGKPLNRESPASTGRYSSGGHASAGCVTIALAQAITLFRENFGVFKGYSLETSWAQLKKRPFNWSFTDENEIKDISYIIKTIAENIEISYNSDGSAGTSMRKGIDFLGRYLGGMYGYDEEWDQVESNMRSNSKGITILSGNEKSSGWLWNVLGIDMPRTSGHAMLLDGFKNVDGRTLFYVNFGWGGTGNGYILYGDKSWRDDALAKYGLRMKVYNFHLDTDYDDF